MPRVDPPRSSSSARSPNNVDELLATWQSAGTRRRLEAALTQAELAGDTDGALAVRHAIAQLPEVSALDALRANAALVDQLTTQRWVAMKIARDEGASWEQIGQALGVSRQSAWEFLRRKLAEHPAPSL